MLGNTRTQTFPPYELLDAWAGRASEKTERLERLYHNTREFSWDPRVVLDELEAKHGGIRVPPEKREALWSPPEPGPSGTTS